MHFPQFWSRASADAEGDGGRTVTVSCRRWSDTSLDEAHESALAQAKRIAARLVRGEDLNRYEYGRGPLAEEVLERLANEQGELTAAVTQNAYGALVLNTARAMFIDIDFESQPV